MHDPITVRLSFFLRFPANGTARGTFDREQSTSDSVIVEHHVGADGQTSTSVSNPAIDAKAALDLAKKYGVKPPSRSGGERIRGVKAQLDVRIRTNKK
jgi:hypothetical protein